MNNELPKFVPTVNEVRQQISANIKERHFLRSLLKLAEKREDAEQARQQARSASCK